MSDFKKITNLIAKDEGFSPTRYKDSKGLDTIGFGFNLNTTRMPMGVALLWMDDIVKSIYEELNHQLSFFKDLNDARKYVLVNMCYQMGINGLLKFRGMIFSLANKDYISASNEMKDSLWYREFTSRANRLVKIMLSGEF